MEDNNGRKGIILECVECGQEFVYTAKQQVDFLSRGWVAPKRCPMCRRWKRYANAYTEGGDKNA